MNDQQSKVIELLAANEKRDLYEGSDGTGKGCGQFYVSYLDGRQCQSLSQAEVDELVAAGILRRKWANAANCFVLSDGAKKYHAEPNDAHQSKLESEMIEAALNLTEYTKASALVVPVPNTDPVLYVAVGEVGKIKSKIDYLASK